MKYIYPKLSKYEVLGIRFSGAGLGNLLFTYSRALILAEKTGCKMIWPTWASLKIGPWIRFEQDKRFYGDLFENNLGYINGFHKQRKLLFSKKITVESIDDIKKASDDSVLIYDDFTMNFNGILEYRELIRNNIISILKAKNCKSLNEDFKNVINVHVRLGDFAKNNINELKQGSHNVSIPISWYVNVIKKIQRDINEDIIFNVFSDGTDEELELILQLKNTRRVFYGTSIADIIALSQSKVMIASGSSFSMWARYLGNSSSISYPNQKKDNILCDKDGFEIELSEKDALSDEVGKKIKYFYSV